MEPMKDNETFYEHLDRVGRERRIARICKDRPENLHDYQGCAKDAALAASKLPPRVEEPTEHPRADCEGCNKPDCPCNKCEGGEPCWFNQETGYREYCPKHEAIVADKAMEVDAARKATLVESDGIGWCSSCDSIHQVKRPVCPNCGDWLIFSSDDLPENKCLGFPKCGVGDKSTSAHEKHCPAYTPVESLPVEAKDEPWMHPEVSVITWPEPKPTPSTPTPDLVERIAVYVESESECLMHIVVEETKRDYGVRLLKVMATEIREKFKPQPDTEQTFEEWRVLPSTLVIFAGYAPSIARLMELAAKSAWNAAKGSK